MKIGIVTAYDENEANSEYSKALKEEFERQGHSVEILRLPFNIFTVPSHSTQKLADILINEMAEKIKNLNYINIQYESQLFGTECDAIKRRVNTLIKACKSKAFSITMHSQINFNSKIINTNILKSFLYRKFKKRKKITFKNINFMIFDILAQVVKHNGMIITHTERAKKRVLSAFPSAHVVAFPLCYKRLEDIQSAKKNFNAEEYKRTKGISLKPGTKVIGILGTFTFWKDFKTVINALLFLPEEYHLFIWGGQHKLEFASHPEGLKSTDSLLTLIRSENLAHRVHFMGYQPSSEDMLNAQLFCDYIVLPYKEVGEDGPGAACSALETCDNVFFSRTATFEELKLFCKECVFNYDMGNYLELAEKIKSLPDKDRIMRERKQYFKTYNITENVKMYLSCCGE